MALNSVTAAAAFAITYLLLRTRQPPRKAGSLASDGRRWLASSIPMALSDGMYLIQGQLSVLLLGILASPTEVGLFRTAVASATIVTTPAIVLNLVTLPVYSRLFAEKDMSRLRRLATRAAQMQFFVMLLISLPLLIDGAEILGIVFGRDYSAAAPILTIALAGFLFSAGCGANGALLNMTGYERRITRAMSAGLIVNLATMPLFVSIFGVVGAALSLAIGTVAWNLIATFDALRLLRVNTTIVPLIHNRSLEATF
jgi:O-antigen/teichoic acid export membrane protein